MSRPAVERVAVIIPAYRASQTLAACVRSVLAGVRVPEQVIIVDDGSPDDTAAVARALAQAHAPRVELVELGENRGPAAARNAGARAAQADAYFFLDSDTEVDRGALDAFARRIAEADAVCGIYAAEPLGGGVAARYKALLDHFHFSRRGVVEYDGFTGSCGGVRAAAFAAIGGFDERLRAGDDYENEDFGYRLSRDHHTLLDPTIQARHHFPGLRRLTRTYFVRVAQWARLFAERRRFESAGDATTETGLATLAVPLAIATVPVAIVWPPAWLATAALVAMWLRGYGPFFVWVVRRAPRDLVACVALNVWLSIVISAGAASGIARHALESLAGAPRRGAHRHGATVAAHG